VDTSRYADLFLTESRENLSAINHALLGLERDSGGGEHVDALFRAVHTVKGMSATMGYARVAELSHALETLLERVRGGAVEVTPALMDALFAAADALERLISDVVGGQSEGEDIAPLVARLHVAAVASDGAATTAAAAPVATGAAVGGGWNAAEPPGAGFVVRVRLAPDTALRGVRAFMVLQKLKALGEVGAVTPSAEALQTDTFGLDFAVRLAGPTDAAAIERAARSAGDVTEVLVIAPGPARPVAARTSGPIARYVVDDVPMPTQRSVRIDLRRLDSLMNLIGELVITRGRLTQLSGTIADPALDETVQQASRLITDLQDEIMTSRMVPVWQVFDRFPRLVRDAARGLGKDVELTVEGKEIELDRSMLDEIGDPLVHLLRNAVDHGIEMPAVREAAGKPRTGRLSLSATRDRSAVLIRVQDDGRGIDRTKVLRRARELDLVDAGKTELGDDELLRLIARPGFSTAETVTDMSGRGVGVDAVQTRVRALGGSLELKSVPGQGTSVTVRLPLTLAIVRALLARVGDETFAVPLSYVNETVELTDAATRSVRGKDVFVLREDVIPLHRLRDLVQMPEAVPEMGPATAAQRRKAASRQVVVLEIGDRRAGLVVDELTGQQEVVVKQFDAVRGGLPLFGGATILGDGAPALILDVNSLL
jgi:two-component system, chemotaxis family, sensor kinase CheA